MFVFVKGCFRFGGVEASMERKYTWNSVVVQTGTLGVVERSEKREKYVARARGRMVHSGGAEPKV